MTRLPQKLHLSTERGMKMLHDVTTATHKGGYLIEIEFDDGSRGVVDFSK